MITKPKTLSQDELVWEVLQEQADRNGENLSEFIADCCLANLDDDLAAKVKEFERPKRGRPKK